MNWKDLNEMSNNRTYVDLFNFRESGSGKQLVIFVQNLSSNELEVFLIHIISNPQEVIGSQTWKLTFLATHQFKIMPSGQLIFLKMPS